MAIKTLTEVLNSMSIEDIDKSAMDDSAYNQKINKLLSDGYSYIGLKDNGEKECGNLLSFKRIKDFSSETILIKSDEVDNNKYSRIGGEVKKNHSTYKDKGTFFGLKYDYSDDGFYTKEVNFFGQGLAKDVWFERMGINTKSIPKHIYVKAKPGKDNKFAIPGSVYVGSGDHAMVYIGDNKIVSAYPVYVFGKSSDWHIEGGQGRAIDISDYKQRYGTCFSCNSLGFSPSNYPGKENILSYREGWNHNFYNTSNEISVTGSLYGNTPTDLEVDQFIKASDSYQNKFINPIFATSEYVTGYKTDDDFKLGYTHSGFDFFNSPNYDFE